MNSIFRAPLMMIGIVLLAFSVQAGPGKFRTNVDDLPLRSSPDLKGEKIGLIKEGTTLVYLGEEADPNLKITIRGIKYDAPWVKIMTPEGQKGWVFRGSVRFWSRPGIGADATKTKALESRIAQLSPLQVSSISRLMEYFKTNYAMDEPENADAAFNPIRQYMYRVASQLMDKAFQDAEMEKALTQHIWEPSKAVTYGPAKALITNAKSNGLKMANDGEGGFYIDIDTDYLRQHLSIYLSADMSRYLEQMHKEDLEGFAADAGLVIPVQKVAERTLWWESFYRELREGDRAFAYPDEVRARVTDNFWTLLHGMDNTPAFGWGENPTLDPEFKRAIQWLAGYQDTFAGKFCKIFLSQLEANDWSLNPELEKMRQDATESIAN